MTRLTRAQAREVDRICAEQYGLPTIVLMENAARALLDACRKVGGGWFVVVCGGGNNGGDGFALARHLHNAGEDAIVLAAKPVDEMTGDAGTNARVCRAMGVPIRPVDAAAVREAAKGPSCVIVDALLGTGLDRPPRADAAEIIKAINSSRPGCRVVAADVPSGLDCDAGRPFDSDACVRADATVTFVAEKIGISKAGEWTGEVVVADVGVPRGVIDNVLGRAASGRAAGSS